MSKRDFTSEYKAKIVIEIIQGESTINEIATQENISPRQLYNWKKEFMENSYRAFSQSKDEKAAQNQVKTAQNKEENLMAKVGQLTIEVDWLKKKYKDINGIEWDGNFGFKK